MKDADRIVGGEAAPSPIPWQVALLSGNWQFCGATILDNSTLLCAAHCGPTKSHSIRVGSVSKSSGGQKRNIAQVIYNFNEGFQYNSQTFNNDFVILKLDSPLVLNGDVQPACLPSSSTYLDVSSTEDRCFTSGWGTLSQGGSSTNTLQYVRVPAITNAECNEDYGGSITDSMICAGYRGVGEKDACQGDSGGPFICNDGGKAVIAGVVSWGNGCALPDYPGVYARTTHVLDWIKEHMGPTGTVVPTEGPPPAPTTAPPPTDCTPAGWVGDSYCDDHLNTEICNWD
jgi:trypsin